MPQDFIPKSRWIRLLSKIRQLKGSSTSKPSSEGYSVEITLTIPATGKVLHLRSGDTLNLTHTVDLNIPSSWAGMWSGKNINSTVYVLKVGAITNRPVEKIPDGSVITFQAEREIRIFEREVKPCCSQLPPEPEGGRIVDL